MADYARPYQEARHFGVWAFEGADDNGRRDALAQLAQSVEQATDRCMRHDRATLEALDYLERYAGIRITIIRRFREALSVQEAPHNAASRPERPTGPFAGP